MLTHEIIFRLVKVIKIHKTIDSIFNKSFIKLIIAYQCKKNQIYRLRN